MWRILLIAALLPAGVALAERTVIAGGTLVNSNGNAPLADATVIIEDGVIVAAGRRDDVRIPGDARTIDAAGKWLIPGLIDSHVHFFQSGGLYTRPDVIDLRSQVPYADEELAGIRARLPVTFRRYLASGVTSVVDVGGPFWNFDVRRMAAGNPLAPRVSVAGPLISTRQPEALDTGDPPIVRITDEDEAREMVRRQARRDADLIKIWYIVGPDDRAEDYAPIVRAVVDESSRHGLRVAVHATQLETARLAVRLGAAILVHSVTDEPVDDGFIALLKQNGVIYTTSLSVFEGYSEVLTQQIRLIEPEYRLGDPYVIGSWFDLRALPAAAIPESRRAALENPQPLPAETVAQRNAKTLQDAGVLLAAGSDAGNIGTLHGPAVFREYELLAEAGLAPQEILVAATLNGAKVMGRDREVGSIEPGKLADIVILNSDPLADIRNTSDIFRVVKGGAVHAPDELLAPSPSDLVQRQLNAYNARDIDAFAATYHENVEIYEHPETLIMRGRDELFVRYENLFADNPQLHARLVQRMALGDFVIDREHVTGRADGRDIDAVAIYKVSDGLISHVWFLRP